MRAVAHGWKPDRVEAPPLKVAKEFAQADQEKWGNLKKHLGGRRGTR